MNEENLKMYEFDFTGMVKIDTLNSNHGDPAHGIKPVTSTVFGIKKDNNIYFWADFSTTHQHEYVNINGTNQYGGSVFDEYQQFKHKLYHDKFITLEPMKCENYSHKYTNYIYMGKGRLYGYPYANENIIDVRYHVEKHHKTTILVKIDWEIPTDICKHWAMIQSHVKKIIHSSSGSKLGRD